MTELRIRLKTRELDYLWRHRDTFFTPPATDVGELIRYRFLTALAALNLDEHPTRSHQRKAPEPVPAPDEPPVTEPDPYADEPEEDA